VRPRALLVVAALTSLPALADCPAQADAACGLPLLSIPPAVGVRVQGDVAAVTAAFSLGAYSGAHAAGARPPWLLLLDIGAAWTPPTRVEPWTRLSVTRLFPVSSALELGAGGSVLLPDFDVTRFAGGLSVLLVLRAGGVALRLSAQVELPLQLTPVFSLALAMSPW